MHFLRIFVRCISALSHWSYYFAAALLRAAVFVVGQMVFSRYVLVGSTVWQTEFVIYAITSTIFLASPHLVMTRGHVRIALWAEHSSPKMRRVLDAVADFFSVLFLFLLAWTGWIYFEEAWANNWLTETAWELPLWIPLLPLPVGVFLAGMQALAEIIRPSLPVGATNGTDTPPGSPAPPDSSKSEAA